MERVEAKWCPINHKAYRVYRPCPYGRKTLTQYTNGKTLLNPETVASYGCQHCPNYEGTEGSIKEGNLTVICKGMKRKTIYISGKMRGMTEEESRKLFKKAEEHLQAQGYDTVNPWEKEDLKKAECEDWGDFIMYDLPILKKCDGIYMLKNWKDSWGAQVEYAFANGMEMEIILFE